MGNPLVVYSAKKTSVRISTLGERQGQGRSTRRAHLAVALLSLTLLGAVRSAPASNADKGPRPGDTIIMWGDSIGYGHPGSTACVSAARQPNLVPQEALTGTCALDRLGTYYRTSVRNLGIGWATLLDVDLLHFAASGIHIYNAPYHCVRDEQFCHTGTTFPALDSLVGPRTWVIFAYSGINDAIADPAKVHYAEFVGATEKIVRDLASHGQDTRKIIFVGALKSNGSPNEAHYLAYTAALKNTATLFGSRFVDEWSPFTAAEANDPTGVLFDVVHPNDAGAKLWAKTIEAAL